MIDNLTDRSIEMTFTVEEADLKKLQEVLYDIKIEECPWFEIHDKYGKSAKYYRDGLSGWIPCSERLPDSKEYVLVTDYGETNIGRRFCGRWWLDCCGDKMKDVTAWMPLPEPYREGK